MAECKDEIFIIVPFVILSAGWRYHKIDDVNEFIKDDFTLNYKIVATKVSKTIEQLENIFLELARNSSILKREFIEEVCNYYESRKISGSYRTTKVYYTKNGNYMHMIQMDRKYITSGFPLQTQNQFTLVYSILERPKSSKHYLEVYQQRHPEDKYILNELKDLEKNIVEDQKEDCSR